MKYCDSQLKAEALKAPCLWALTIDNLEQVARNAIGVINGGWVRRGNNPIEICGEYGSDARKLGEELRRIARGVDRILTTDGNDKALRAATYYHLSFQRIHPLVEGNGRVGRVILAAQLQHELRNLKGTG